MTWEIRLPYRHRDDSLSAVAEAAHELPTDESRVVRQIVLGEIVGGSAKSVGEFLDKLEAMAPAERRELLDEARVKAGLESASDIEFAEQHRRRQLSASIKGANDPRPLRVAYTDTGSMIDLNERDDEAARLRVQEESRRGLREERLAIRALEAAEFAEHERARDAAHRRELGEGFA